MPKVTFLPGKRSVEVPAGYTIFDAATLLGVPLPADCGGNGTCGKCRVRFPDELPEPNETERDLIPAAGLAAGYRLACQQEVTEDVTIEVPAHDGTRPTKGMAANGGVDLELDPPVRRVSLAAAEALGLDWSEGAQQERQRFARAGRRNEELEVIVFEREALTVRPAGRPILGVTFDIGTTTIGGYLMDLEIGKELSALATSNPQGAYGADVISRIAYASSRPDGLSRLQGLCLSALNDLLQDMAGDAGVHTTDIFYITAVGNPTMMHLLLGVDPQQISVPPFQPVFKDSQRTTARALSLSTHPEAKVETLPMVSGYVGADTVGMALYLRLDLSKEVCIAIDVGTNGEIILCKRGQLYACSTAAGPAFEGARIQWGMRAQPGAIDSMQYDASSGRFVCHTIADAPPKGICGPGLLSIVATLVDAQVIEPSGRFRVACQPGISQLRQNGSQWEFLLVKGEETQHGQDIVLTQRDVRELQLAKSAMAAGMYRLLSYAGLALEEVNRICLAGAFGSFLDPWSARRVGLLLPVPLDSIVATGNAAGAGGRMVLCSKHMHQVAADIAGKVDYLELSGDAEFNDLFMREMEFPSGD